MERKEACDITVSGVLVRVENLGGLTAAQIVQQLAAAINADTSLQALGVSASAVG